MSNLENLQFSNIAPLVQAEISSFLTLNKSRLTEISGDFEVVHQSLESFLNGGKRLRPAFMLAGFIAAGGKVTSEMVRAATSLEFIQASALIHDDLMDASDTRRGFATIHKQFEKLHQTNKWQGDGAWYGNSAAILLGTLCLVWADQIYFESGVSAEELLRAKSTYDSLRVEVLAGQYLDVLEQNRRTADTSQIRNIVRHKTAKYTVEKPLLLGAEIFGASIDQKTALSKYGLAIGEAFQYRDDILGLFGDPQITGKPVGDDLREGKRTLLVALLHERATSAQWNWFEQFLGNPDLKNAEIQSVCNLMVEHRILQDTEEVISNLENAAQNALSATQFTDAGHALLAELTQAALKRSL